MRVHWSGLSRAFTLLGALAGLAACVAQPYGYGYPPPTALTPQATAPTSRATRAVALLPLTGSAAELGQSMLKAAQLAAGPTLQSQDTGGTPEGAARAARAALANGAGILLGPLTAPETAAVTPIARAANIPVLAFTSDESRAEPGVFTLGITPAQQVRRLVAAVQAEGRARIAAILPTNAFGNALEAGLLAATTDARLPPPLIVHQTPGPNGLAEALKELAASAGLHGPGDAIQAAAPEPARIDALLIGASGEALQQALPTLAAYQTGPDHIRLLGTALWIREAPRLSAIAGAWYAAPSPGPLAAFEQQYRARYGSSPAELAGLAYDAAAVARAAAGPDGYNAAALLRPEGFAGADGVFALQPSGTVRRALALFEIDRTGAHLAQPGQQSLAGSGF